MKDVLALFSNMSILYVEDEESLRLSVSKLLGLIFKKVHLASNGEEGLNIFLEQRVDICLVDLYMPKLDGISFIKEVRAKRANMPIIILSAHTDKEHLFSAIELNVCKFLLKPFSKESFFESLKICAKWMYNFGDSYLIQIKQQVFYNPLEKILLSSNDKILLTKKESQLFEYFLRHKKRILSFEELENELYEDLSSHKEALKALIKELRKKLPSGVIENVFGVGYKFELS